MAHSEIFKLFKRFFDIADEEIDCWFPNGKGSIRVRFKPTSSQGLPFERVFTYFSDFYWRLETVDSYLEKLTGKKKGCSRK